MSDKTVRWFKDIGDRSVHGVTSPDEIVYHSNNRAYVEVANANGDPLPKPGKYVEFLQSENRRLSTELAKAKAEIERLKTK